ncbi:MAG: T9SS type A sorting domain-containing protein [Bacteroidia bacterium]
MKKLIPVLTLVICFFLLTKKSEASHLTGGEITYTCTATAGTYQVTLTLYRDCTGIPLGSCTGSCSSGCSYTLTVLGADASCNGTSYGNFTVNLVNVTDANPNPLCPNSKSICTNMGCVTAGTYTPGVEKYTFRGNVNLNSMSIPTSCCNVRISFTECCRNGSINTGPAGNTFYVETVFNRCITPCNSAPICSNDPFVIICGGQPYIFNNGAIDPDMDSLSYSFAPALQAAGTPVTYTAPYSATAPMPYMGGNPNALFPLGIHCDSTNGDVSFTPPYSGSGYFVGIVTIQIQQWKNISGVPTVIGKTMRDVQMWLQQCVTNSPPYLMTYPLNGNQPIMNWTVIAGQPLCFNIIARDSDFAPYASPPRSDTTYLTWNGSLTSFGATFTKLYTDSLRKINGPRQDSVRFCWTPDTTKISSVPYYFSVIGRDNRCPVGARTTRAFAITVTRDLNVSILQTPNGCRTVKLSYVQNGTPQSISSSLWKISKIPNNYTMTSVDSFSNTIATSYLNFSSGGKYLVKLNIASASGLTKTIYDTIVMDQPVTISVNDTTICPGSSATFNFLANGGRVPYSYRWFIAPDTFINPLNTPFFTSTTFSISPASTTKYILQARDLNGCRGYDTSVIVTVRPMPVSSLPASARICKGNTYALDAGNNSGNVKKYFWNTGDTVRTITRGDSNLFIVTLTDTLGCKVTDSLVLNVNPAIPANAGNDTTLCGSGIVNLRASGGQNYLWKNITTGSVIAPKSSNPNMAILVGTTSSFEATVYATYSGLECSKKDTMNVTVNPKPLTPVITGLTSVPHGQSNNFSVTNTSGSSYNWFVSNGNINSGNGTNQVSVVFANVGTGMLKVFETNLNNCKSDTGAKSISVTIGVGLKEQNSFEYCKIYPNPTSGILNIELTTDEKQIQVEVTDVLGKVLSNTKYSHTTGEFKTSLDLSNLHQGIYFVSVKAGERAALNRITVE